MGLAQVVASAGGKAGPGSRGSVGSSRVRWGNESEDRRSGPCPSRAPGLRFSESFFPGRPDSTPGCEWAPLLGPERTLQAGLTALRGRGSAVRGPRRRWGRGGEKAGPED